MKKKTFQMLLCCNLLILLPSILHELARCSIINVPGHTYFDVIPYGIPGLAWGNTRDSVEGCIKACVAVLNCSTIKKFNQSNDAKFYQNQIEDRIQ